MLSQRENFPLVSSMQEEYLFAIGGIRNHSVVLSEVEKYSFRKNKWTDFCKM